MDEQEELPPTKTLVKAYIKMRDARTALSAEFEAKDKDLKEQMRVVENYLQEACKRAGGNVSIPGVGVVIRGVDTRYWTSDWESMHNFIQDHKAFDLLERRVHQTNMKSWLEENPNFLPQGLNSESRYSVTVRRSK